MKPPLKTWALAHNISHSALNGLLKLLKPLHEDLPLDARTLLGTASTSSNIDKFEEGGEFCYFGVKFCLNSFLENYGTDVINKIDSCLYLNFNIDGIPLYRSSPISFWLILCTINNVDMMPLVIGIYCGTRKPNINSYLQKFTEEMREFTSIMYKGIEYSIKVRAIIADAPAKSFIKQIK